jgi:hypothetical protein
VVIKHFKHKRFHPKGEATSRPIITGARPFLRSGQTRGICFVKKKELMGEGCTFSKFSLSFHIIKVWRQRSTHVCVFCSRQFSKGGKNQNKGGFLLPCEVASPGGVVHCHVQSWGVFLCFTLQQESRFPRFGGRLYATISFEIGIRCTEELVRFANFSASDGVAIISLQRDRMCGKGGFKGWKG